MSCLNRLAVMVSMFILIAIALRFMNIVSPMFEAYHMSPLYDGTLLWLDGIVEVACVFVATMTFLGALAIFIWCIWSSLTR